MSVFALGLNHTTAPVDLRGRFAFAPEQIAPTLCAFRDKLLHSSEVAIVSTCNRTELYVGANPTLLTPAIDWLAQIGGVSGQTLRQHSYVFEGSQARAMPSASPAGSIRWCWASRRSSAR